MLELTHFSLCSGIGGIDLAAELAGFKTVAQCEIDPYASKVLAKNFKGVHNFGDIRTVNKESFREQTGSGVCTVVSAGFPCQPFSTAGKRRGKEDDRYLWPEVFRVVSELGPAWFVGENVAGFISMGLDTALSDLENKGYETRAFTIPACAVGAFHRRERVFIVAHSSFYGFVQGQTEILRGESGLPSQSFDSSNFVLGNVSDVDVKRRKRSCKKQIFRERRIPIGQGCCYFQDVERRFDMYQSRLCRSLHGLPSGVDRVRCLGNAVVPQQIYPIFEAIARIEHESIIQ